MPYHIHDIPVRFFPVIRIYHPTTLTIECTFIYTRCNVGISPPDMWNENKTVAKWQHAFWPKIKSKGRVKREELASKQKISTKNYVSWDNLTGMILYFESRQDQVLRLYKTVR